MKIQPASSFLLVQMRDHKRDSKIVLPAGVQLQPHGFVLAAGRECGPYPPGSLVLFLASNLIMGFNENTAEECFLVPESAVIGKYVSDKFEELNTAQ